MASDLFGILNINKPLKFTSHDVVAKLRKILNIKQIGHTGTLDPMAVGVLPVCIGKATKIIQYLEDGKAYRAFIKLGVRTDTCDAEGTILETNPVDTDKKKLESVINEFQGKITQIPPMHSAVHYKGKRLYEYARANKQIDDIPERKIEIYSIKLVDIEEAEFPIVIIDVECSSGTYIRSIARDIGDKLGYGASLNGLIRTKAGKFTLETSKTLDEVQEIVNQNRLNEILINPVEVLDLKLISVNSEEADKIKKGQYIKICDNKNTMNIEKIQLVYENKLIAIARIRDNKAFPINVFI